MATADIFGVASEQAFLVSVILTAKTLVYRNATMFTLFVNMLCCSTEDDSCVHSTAFQSALLTATDLRAQTVKFIHA